MFLYIWIQYRLPCLQTVSLDPTYPATYPACIYIAFFACFCHLYVGPIRGTSARQNGDFSFSYSLLLLPPPSLTPSPTPGPTPSSPTLILIIPISTPISPTPSPTSTPSLLWNLYGRPIRRECGGIPCDHGPPNAQVAIRRVYVARGSMGPGAARVLLPVPTRPPRRRLWRCL